MTLRLLAAGSMIALAVGVAVAEARDAVKDQVSSRRTVAAAEAGVVPPAETATAEFGLGAGVVSPIAEPPAAPTAVSQPPVVSWTGESIDGPRQKVIARKSPTGDLRIPFDPSTGNPTATGRIIVKFKDELLVRAPQGAMPFPTSTAGANLRDVEWILSGTRSTVKQFVDRPVAELEAIANKAFMVSGRPQPDLASILVVEPPLESLLVAAQALNDLDIVDWVEIERWVVPTQCGEVLQPCFQPACVPPPPLGPLCGCNPVLPNPVYGCSDVVCCTRVAAILPSCGDEGSPRGWDSLCAAIAHFVCTGTIYESSGNAGPYDPCFANSVLPLPQAVLDLTYLLSGPCFVARPTRGCDQPECCAAVCQADPFCCSNEWDFSCTQMAADPDLSGFCQASVSSLNTPTPDYRATAAVVTEDNSAGAPQFVVRARPVSTDPNLPAYQAYMVGHPVIGWQSFVPVPPPPYVGEFAFLASGYRGWGLDLEEMRELGVRKQDAPGWTPGPPRLNGRGVNIGVIDFGYDEAHEAFICETQDASGNCISFYDPPRVIAEPGQTQSNLAFNQKGHGTAVLGMLVAGGSHDSTATGFGITGIANEAQGYFFPLFSQEEGFRLPAAIFSLLNRFEPGDIAVFPIALAPGGSFGNDNPTQQPIVTSPIYWTLLRLATDLGITSFVAAGNSCSQVGPEAGEDGVRSGALVVGAANPGAYVEGAPIGGCDRGPGPYSREVSSNFFVPGDEGGTVDLFAWGNSVVTAGGLGELFRAASPGDPAGSNRAYTANFGGTSAATAMVAGAAAVLQGFAKQRFALGERPADLGAALRDNGLPQGGGVGLLGNDTLCVPDWNGGGEQLHRIGSNRFGRGVFPQLKQAAFDILNGNGPCTLVTGPPIQFTVPPAGQSSIEVVVNLTGTQQLSRCSWTATANESWVQVTTAAGTGEPGNNVLTFSVTPNPGIARTAFIGLFGGSQVQLIEIEQAGCGVVAATPPAVVVSPQGQAKIEVLLDLTDPTCTWTANTIFDWIEITQSSGTGTGAGRVLSFNVASSGKLISRTGIIRVSTAGGSIDIPVVQTACGIVDVDPPLVTVPISGAVDVALGVELAGVDCSWTATSLSPWITISIGSGTGQAPGNIVVFDAAAGDPGQTRTGSIRITSGADVVLVPVIQTQCEIDAVLPATFDVGFAGATLATAEITLSEASCPWTATTPTPWIQLVTAAGSGVNGENQLRFNVLPNTAVTPRTGTIQIFSGNDFFQVPVVQDGLDPSVALVVDYRIWTGVELSPPGTFRLDLADGVTVDIRSLRRNQGDSVSGLVYIATGWITDIEADVRYRDFDPALPNGGVVGLTVTNVASSAPSSPIRIAYVRNRITGRYDIIGNDLNVPPVPAPAVFVLPPFLNALDYVNPSSGVVNVRIVTYGLGASPSYIMRHDFIGAASGAFVPTGP